MACEIVCVWEFCCSRDSFFHIFFIYSFFLCFIWMHCIQCVWTLLILSLINFHILSQRIPLWLVSWLPWIYGSSGTDSNFNTKCVWAHLCKKKKCYRRWQLFLKWVKMQRNSTLTQYSNEQSCNECNCRTTWRHITNNDRLWICSRCIRLNFIFLLHSFLELAWWW